MQVVYAVLNGGLCELTLPGPNDHVLPGVQWGAFDELMTPAYWRSQAWQHDVLGTYADFRLGRTLAEEVAACLLGGFGMPAELGLAAYARLREGGLLDGKPSIGSLEAALSEPFEYEGKQRSYRFARQKSRYLAGCLARLQELAEFSDDLELRDALTALPGIGLKTASWIVRNYRASDAVAIIDVHILRAGRHVGLFAADWTPQQHYRELETAFLCFAKSIGTPAALLDGLMWDQMRRMPSQCRLGRDARFDSTAASTRQLKLSFERERDDEAHASAASTSRVRATRAV